MAHKRKHSYVQKGNAIIRNVSSIPYESSEGAPLSYDW